MKNRRTAFIFLSALVVLLLVVVGLSMTTVSARRELRDARERLILVEKQRDEARDEAAALRGETVRLRARIDQQEAMLTAEPRFEEMEDLRTRLAESDRRIRELERRLAASASPETEIEASLSAEPAPEAAVEEAAPEPSEEERRRQREEQRAAFRERAQGLLAERIEAYRSRLAEESDPAGIEVGAAIVDRLQQMDQLLVTLSDAADPQARREAYARMGALWRDLMPLMEQDRDLRLRSLATQIGYEDADAADRFVDYIRRIYEDTSFTPGQLFGRRGRPR